MTKSILFCMTGNIRTFKRTKEGFYRVVKKLVEKGYNVDIKFSTYTAQYGYHPYIRDCIGYHEDIILPREIINEIVSSEFIKSIKISDINEEEIYSQNVLPEKTRNIFQGFLMNRRLIDCLSLNLDYDCCIRTRFDSVYKDEELLRTIEYVTNLNNESKNFYIDCKNVYPNDCVIICKPNILKMMGDSINSEYFNPSCELSISKPPHGFLHNFILVENLNVVARDLCDVERRQNIEDDY